MENSILWQCEFDPDHPEPAFSALMEAWKSPKNRVFSLRAAGPVTDPKGFFSDHFSEIGTPVALAEDVAAGDRSNQRTGEIWMEVRYDPKHPDAYRHSSNPQPLHTDGSYIPDFPNATLMTCVANSGEGGETTFIASEDVVAALQNENPDLLARLSRDRIRHARSGDQRNERIIDANADPILVNWNYYCLARDLPAAERESGDEFFQFLQTSPMILAKTIAVKLGPGDAVTWKDREVLHGRNGFVAEKESERFIWKCAIDVGRL
jgi:alpha-ketoglutarate-dependent taurine dioxygenase